MFPIEALFSTMYVVLGVLCVVGLALHHMVLGRLRTRHLAKWTELGSPSLFTNNTVKNSFSVQRFLRSKEFLSLGDKRLNAMCKLLWRLQLVYLALFTGILAAFVLGLWLAH